MTNWGVRRTDPKDGSDLSAEELERRLRGDAIPEGPLLDRLRGSRPSMRRGPRRVVSSRTAIGRDTAIILGGALLAVLLANLAGFGAAPGASPTPGDSTTVIGGSLPPDVTYPPLDTLGPIVNPSVGIEATPTPIPVITLPPGTPTPHPTPRATPKPTKPPAPTPTPTPPPPVAAFSCTVDLLTVTCTNESSGYSSWQWDWGDGPPVSSGPGDHTYAQGGQTVTIGLTVFGIGPPSSTSHDYVIP